MWCGFDNRAANVKKGWVHKGEKQESCERIGNQEDLGSVNGSLTVSSVQMEWTWVPNITEVKMRKRRPSKHRSMRRITVAGGEKVLHSGGWRDIKEETWRGKKEGCMKKCYNSKHNKPLHSTGSPPAALEWEGSVSRYILLYAADGTSEKRSGGEVGTVNLDR